MTNKLTIEDILKKKKILENIKSEPYYSEFFEKEIEIEDIKPSKIMEIINNADETEPLRADWELIYTCCPIFRNKELLEEYSINDPIDIIGKIYGNNIIEPSNLAKHILKRYGFYINDGVNKIKKP